MSYKKYQRSEWKFECATCENVFYGSGKAWSMRKSLCTRIGKTGNPSDYNCDACADRIEGV